VAISVNTVCRPAVLLVGCSHQYCANLSGPSAEGLVAGRKGVRCGGCGVARYCSLECQEVDWHHHWRVCRRLAAATTPPPAGQSQDTEGAMGTKRNCVVA
jgi:hypothetical protein